jgi:hypothetical protein
LLDEDVAISTQRQRSAFTYSLHEGSKSWDNKRRKQLHMKFSSHSSGKAQQGKLKP